MKKKVLETQNRLTSLWKNCSLRANSNLSEKHYRCLIFKYPTELKLAMSPLGDGAKNFISSLDQLIECEGQGSASREGGSMPNKFIFNQIKIQ